MSKTPFNFYIQSPSDDHHKPTWWADYWVKHALSTELHNYDNHYSSRANKADYGLLLFNGRHRTIKSRISSIWVYNLPSQIDLEKCKKYDIVYALSSSHYQYIKDKHRNVKLLLPATNKAFSKQAQHKDIDILLMGNRTDERQQMIERFRSKHKVRIVGQGWQGYEDLVIAEYWPNSDLSSLFRRSKLSLYNHKPDALRWNHVAIRVLDILACSDCLVLTDSKGLQDDLAIDIPLYAGEEQVKELLTDNVQRLGLNKKAQAIISEKHTFKHRVEQILADYQEIRN